MPINNEGLLREFEYVTRPGEKKHIGESLDLADDNMQEIGRNWKLYIFPF